MLLHRDRIDPLWRDADRTGGYGRLDPDSAMVVRRAARRRVYSFLAERMGIEREACHTAQFTLEQCREAWLALFGVTYPEIRQWAQLHRGQKPRKAA